MALYTTVTDMYYQIRIYFKCSKKLKPIIIKSMLTIH